MKYLSHLLFNNEVKIVAFSTDIPRLSKDTTKLIIGLYFLPFLPQLLFDKWQKMYFSNYTENFFLSNTSHVKKDFGT